MPDRRPLAALAHAEHIGPMPHGLSLGQLDVAPDKLQLLAESLLQSLTDDPTGAAMAILPALAPMFKSLGKPVSEMEGATFTPKPGSGLPKRLSLSNWDAREGNLDFHSPKGERFQSTPAQADRLIDGGALDLEQPPAKGVTASRRKISKQLDAKAQR